MIRFGLCCLFREEPIRFRHVTAARLGKLNRAEQLKTLSTICLENTQNLLLAVETAARLGIGAFRILSQLFPLYTHPKAGYELADLPDADAIQAGLRSVRIAREKWNLRLSFHPDQFILINSPRADVIVNSVRELEYQAMVARMVGADVINIHLGGVYGDKTEACRRFMQNFRKLDPALQTLLTLENDDRHFTPEDLFPVSNETGVPLVYDIHHHRCNPDRFTFDEVTGRIFSIWAKVGREPYFHISSPKFGWDGKNLRPHADLIHIQDVPSCWLNESRNFTLDVEAKDKEVAVITLQRDIKMMSNEI